MVDDFGISIQSIAEAGTRHIEGLPGKAPKPTDTLINVSLNAGHRAADESGHKAGDHEDFGPRFWGGGVGSDPCPLHRRWGGPRLHRQVV
jgi:hypothetical protein